MSGRWLDSLLPGVTLLGVVAAVTLLPAAAAPGFLPFGDYAQYDANTPRLLPLLEPIVHAPWLGQPGVAMALVVSVLFATAFWFTGRSAGATPAATAIALAGFVSRPELRDLLAAAAPAMGATACLWIALAAPAAGARGVVASAVLSAGACALWPPAVVLVPVAVAWHRRTATAAATVLGSAIGLAAGAWRWAALATTIGGEPLAAADIWPLFALTEARGAHAYVWPPLSAARLPLMLMIAGLVSAAGEPRGRVRRAAGIAGTFVVIAATPLAWRDEVLRAAYWLAWPLAAMGVSWLAGRAHGWGRPLVLGVSALVLIGGGVSTSLRQIETLEPRAFAAKLAGAVTTTGEVAYVAEDLRVDTAMVALRGPALRRLRPSPALVDARLAAGERIVAAGGARAGLELWGYRLRQGAHIDAPVPFAFGEIAGRFRCMPVATSWRALPGLEFTGRLGVHLPAGRGRFEAVVLAPRGEPSVSAINGRPRGRVTRLPLELHTLPAVLWPEREAAPDPSLSAFAVSLDAVETSATSTSLALGSRAPAVAVRFIDDARSPGVATVCAAPLPREDGLNFGPEWTVPFDPPAFFVAGWHAIEGPRAAIFRWATGDATLLLPSSEARDVVVAIDARPAVGDGEPPTLTATVNGWIAGAHVMRGPGPYRWAVPRAIWVDGANEVRFQVSRTARPSDQGSHDTRELGMMVTAIRVTVQNNAAGK